MNKFKLPEAFLVALKAVNVDPPFLFRKSGLPPTLCSSGDGMISTEQNFRLWHTLGEISDDPAIGLRMATLNVHHPPTWRPNMPERSEMPYSIWPALGFSPSPRKRELSKLRTSAVSSLLGLC
jgi:Arabinose-binding domain of AraC transcription regulator, N-term